MNFLYLIPPSNKYYPIRDEEFIVKELLNENQSVIVINKFFKIKILYYILVHKPNAIIFSSLNIGKKINIFIRFIVGFLNTPIYWWYFDSANADSKRKKLVKKISKKVTLFLNRDKINFADYKNNNIKSIWFDQGVPNILKYESSNENYDFDLGFFGSLSSVHKSRAQFLKKIDSKYNLAIYTKDKNEFKKLGFKNVKNYVFKNKISSLVSKIKIVLVLNSSCSAPYYWSDRIHIMIGSGAFCLTEKITGIEKTYKSNKHHILFENNNDFFHLVDYWLKQNDKREKIRFDGFKYAHKFHSYNSRVKEFLKIVH